jgi:hypothetical protein
VGFYVDRQAGSFRNQIRRTFEVGHRVVRRAKLSVWWSGKAWESKKRRAVALYILVGSSEHRPSVNSDLIL